MLRDVPGLVIASPARPDDAAAMLRTCVAAAKVDGSVCVFLEPIALYHTRDLHEDGDELWLGAPGTEHVPVGAAYTHRGGDDLTIVTWANGLRMSLRVARRLRERGIGVSVVDLRWLAPLPMDEVLREATATGRVLVVDETRRTGGVGEGVVAELLDAGYAGRLARVVEQGLVRARSATRPASCSSRRTRSRPPRSRCSTARAAEDRGRAVPGRGRPPVPPRAGARSRRQPRGDRPRPRSPEPRARREYSTARAAQTARNRTMQTMATSPSTRKVLSDAQIAEVLGLMQGADSVELKLTVPESHQQSDRRRARHRPARGPDPPGLLLRHARADA